jgi:hypothetical protein
VSEPLPIEVSALAAGQVRAAETWWKHNWPKAPGAIRSELERASSLIALQPGIGTRARETLHQRLARGPLEIGALVDHATNLADALDTALCHCAGAGQG